MDPTSSKASVKIPLEALAHADASTSDPEESRFGERPQASTSSVANDECGRPRKTYDEYDTVDWVKDLNADSDRRSRMGQRAKYSLLGRLLLVWDSSSGWICVGLIGALVGLFAVMVDIGVSWLSSLREGVCRDQLWLNQEQCCWSYNMTVFSPLYGLSSPSAVSHSTTAATTANSTATEITSVSLTMTSNATTKELIYPRIAGSGAQAAFGFYSCEQINPIQCLPILLCSIYINALTVQVIRIRPPCRQRGRILATEWACIAGSVIWANSLCHVFGMVLNPVCCCTFESAFKTMLKLIEVYRETGTDILQQFSNPWYSWERLLTGHDGDLEHVGAFILGWMIYILLAVSMAGLCAALVYFLAPSAAGSGIAEVKTILGGFVIRNFLGSWTLIVKVAGLILSVSTGLCIGNDGPMVHVGACCAKILAHFFPKYGLNPSKTRELISAAVAGGIGACFGAPIGGVLFSLEVASYYFPAKTLFRSFFCALAAAYVARALNPFGEEHFILLSVDHDTTWHFVELVPFAALGVCGVWLVFIALYFRVISEGAGIFGALMVRCNKAVQKFRRKHCAERPITYLLILTAVFSLIAYLHPDLRVEEKLFIRKLVSSCTAGDQEDLCDYIRLPEGGYGNATIVSETNLVGSFRAGPRMARGVALLFGALLFKFVGLVLVYGVPVPTGVMLPSIMVGAILGRLMGIMVEQIVVTQMSHSLFYHRLCKPGHPCIDTSLYAVVGAAACLGGVTRATVSLVVIMIELIGGLSYSIPIMVASMFAKWMGDRLYKGSLYDVQIRLNHYPYLQFDKAPDKMADSFASDIMHPRLSEGPLELLTENSMRVEEVEELLQRSDHNGFPVVESLTSRHLVGFVSRTDLVRALDLHRPHSLRRHGVKSIVCFTDRAPLLDPSNRLDTPEDFPLLVDVRNVVDLSPTTLTQATPASTIFDVFKSLGLRQVLVTHLGRVTGIITKKDVLRFLDDC
ncbi:H(+)/Cl(-) exchange transporter 4 [Echinococcus granulosus]|uniref:Chloride channel protein n=1 Tax=Echinococcus granulosus TaxID=6210 RepID=W6ULM2_ECHGR|nr:H(+)/Cl(-) exchange transporter 4 [Echinococcus granulosus]EUB62026.1 H(+)/Cl(-) exchange transporter 4 [Echinococcus granulosus]